ncbi:MAG: glycine betaine ABC transporter substrate-binding protein [Candidatus Melainabacteria bacterium]
MMRFLPITLLVFALSLAALAWQPAARAQDDNTIRIASKNFSEQLVLGEMMAQMLEAHTDLTVERQFFLGGTMLTFDALKQGSVDVYPEYTGTVLINILGQPGQSDPQATYRTVNRILDRQYQMTMLTPFGFDNTYALAVRNDDPRFRNVRTISELVAMSDQLVLGGVHDFFVRPDGFNNMQKAYGLQFSKANQVAMDAGLMYTAVNEGSVDVISAFSTDGRIATFNLRLLKDDRHYFPPYFAAPLVRQAVLKAHPEVATVLNRLGNTLNNETMRQLNNRVDAQGQTAAEVANDFLLKKGLVDHRAAQVQSTRNTTLLQYFWIQRGQLMRYLNEHMVLTLITMGLAIVVSIPLGIALTRLPKLEGPVFTLVNTLQTIPSLALLGFMIPLLGIGMTPAIVALFLYSLLPLVRNTFIGIREVDGRLLDACRGMGLTDRQILTHVELPLALPTIMAGIRTSTVIVVGTATLAAFIGAGGLGTPIFRGISAVNSRMILLGAIPSALLAIALDQGLHWLSSRLTPSHHSQPIEE